MRARSDANKTLDVSAGQAISVLNQEFGTQINQYAFTDISRLEETVEKVVTWDSKVGRKYDPRWISLHGIDAFLKNEIAFEPKERWIEINKLTRKEYIAGFRKAMAGMKKGDSK